MTKETLDKALGEIIKALQRTDIEIFEKVELMINLKHFLMEYDKNIKVLRR